MKKSYADFLFGFGIIIGFLVCLLIVTIIEDTRNSNLGSSICSEKDLYYSHTEGLFNPVIVCENVSTKTLEVNSYIKIKERS